MIPHHGSQRPASGGHYESWFLRANHPHAPQALWIRYTQFIPADGRRAPLGELWAIWFDDREIVAVKEEVPLEQCRFARGHLDVSIGPAWWRDRTLRGEASRNGHSLRWHLHYDEGGPPLLTLPARLYNTPLPKAKLLVTRPQVHVDGVVEVDGTPWHLEHWPGSENHNWGSRHTDRYAWGQVAAFDNEPDAFLECATAQVKIGPVMSPKLSIAVLCLGDEELAFNHIGTAFRARGDYDFFRWDLTTRHGDARLEVTMEAPRERFAALTYFNPPGGNKTCLNSKLAACRVVLERRGEPALELVSEHGAAFEILTDRDDHGCPLLI